MNDIVMKKKTAGVPAAAQPVTRAEPEGKTRTRRWSLSLIIVSGLFMLALVAAVVMFVKYQQVKSDPSSVTAAQTSDLVAKVGKLIDLPKDETPTIATVSDKSKLTNQPFFKSADNGDKLLIYTKAKQAIIYRPSANKIINVGPIALTDGAAAATPGTTPANK